MRSSKALAIEGVITASPARVKIQMKSDKSATEQSQANDLSSHSCANQLDCQHTIVDEDGACWSCSALVPWSRLTDEYRHVIPRETSCDCPDDPHTFQMFARPERGVEVVACAQCWAELSYESI